MAAAVKCDLPLEVFDVRPIAFGARACQSVERCVETVDIALVVLGMVQLEGRGIVVRLEGVVLIREGWKFVGAHGSSLSSDAF